MIGQLFERLDRQGLFMVIATKEIDDVKFYNLVNICYSTFAYPNSFTEEEFNIILKKDNWIEKTISINTTKIEER